MMHWTTTLDTGHAGCSYNPPQPKGAHLTVTTQTMLASW